ncbi:MAG: SelT/SelW/SelH family protein [Betaproteobacteria bacterium]|nr:SelT/SelW/SelH family protein [Betaproteobacteria bacterium]
MPQATSLAAEISAKLGVQPELIRGTDGVFDVVADGKLIFSKHRARRFPDPDEVVQALKS